MVSGYLSGRYARAIVLEAVAIVFIAIAAGLIANYLSPYRLPLFASEQDLKSSIPPEIERISLSEARKQLDKPGVIFLDARSPKAFATGHVKGALSLPVGKFDEMHTSLQEQMQAAKLLICYCDSTTCGLSHQLCEQLSAAGYSNIAVMPNGWDAWRQANHPMSFTKEKH